MPRVLVLVTLLFACKKAPGSAPPARFCDQDLSGLWLNSSDKHFAYRLSDREGKISGEFVERHDDGGMEAPSEPIRFELARTADSVAGVMRTTGAAPSGRVCPVEYGFRLTDCKAASVQAVVETSAVIDDDCKRKLAEDGGQIPADLTEFRFERAPQGP